MQLSGSGQQQLATVPAHTLSHNHLTQCYSCVTGSLHSCKINAHFKCTLCIYSASQKKQQPGRYYKLLQGVYTALEYLMGTGIQVKRHIMTAMCTVILYYNYCYMVNTQSCACLSQSRHCTAHQIHMAFAKYLCPKPWVKPPSRMCTHMRAQSSRCPVHSPSIPNQLKNRYHGNCYNGLHCLQQLYPPLVHHPILLH